MSQAEQGNQASEVNSQDKQEISHNQKPSQELIKKTKQDVNEEIKATEESKQNLEKQLLEMGFESNLVHQALIVTSTKDKAIEYIITSLDALDKPIEKGMGMIGKGEGDMEQGEFEDVEEDYKMVFLARMDLKMGLGKVAAQVAHATLKAYKQMEYKADHNELDEVSFFEWLESGQKKIVVKVNDEKQLLQIINKAERMKINACYIRDAGLTQIAAGSLTVGAIGPAASSEIDSITKHLKLL